MDLVRDKFISFLEKYYLIEPNLQITKENLPLFIKFLADRRNASIGDSLINFAYSCSKSLALNECTGIKVSDDILLLGYNESKLQKWLKLPGKKKDQANALEALIFFMWLNYNYSIEDIALCILAKLNVKEGNLNNGIEEKRISSVGFTNLFDSFHELIQKDL